MRNLVLIKYTITKRRSNLSCPLNTLYLYGVREHVVQIRLVTVTLQWPGSLLLHIQSYVPSAALVEPRSYFPDLPWSRPKLFFSIWFPIPFCIIFKRPLLLFCAFPAAIRRSSIILKIFFEAILFLSVIVLPSRVIPLVHARIVFGIFVFVVFLCILIYCICTSNFTKVRVFGVFYIVISFADIVFCVPIVTFVGSSCFWRSWFECREFIIIIIINFIGDAMGVEGVSSLVG